MRNLLISLLALLSSTVFASTCPSYDARCRATLISNSLRQNGISSDEKYCNIEGRAVQTAVDLRNKGRDLSISYQILVSNFGDTISEARLKKIDKLAYFDKAFINDAGDFDTYATVASICMGGYKPVPQASREIIITQTKPSASKSSIPDSYDPIPEAWNIKIGLPGTLSVGADYCTQSGQCKTVGSDIVGFKVGETAIGGIQGCGEHRDAAVCLNARVPVEVIAASPQGSVIVRLEGRNYAVSGMEWYKKESDGSFIGGPISVIDHGASIPLRIYLKMR